MQYIIGLQFNQKWRIYNKFQYLMKKSEIKITYIALVIIFLSLAYAQDKQAIKYDNVSVGKPQTFKLTGQGPFVGRYQLQIDKNDVPKDVTKWYVFAMAEPKQKSSQLLGSPTKIQIKKQDTLLTSCEIIEQSDSCFVKNSQFDYKKDRLHFSVHCDEACQFQFVTEIDYAYPLKINKPFKLDFEKSAYSKIFTIDLKDESFYELRVLLSPRGFIQYGEPVVLLANYGDEIPTQQKHDFKGIHTWDDGQGIFVRKTDLKQDKLTILVQGPEKNVLSLIAEGWQKQQRLQLMEYFPEFDWIRGGQKRQAVINLNQSFTHRVKVVVFSGGLEMPEVLKLDEGLSGKITPLQFAMPSQKYGQFEFRISKQLIQKQKLKKVLIRFTAKKQTTYIIFYAREQASITTILPYVSQSSILQPKQTDQYYFKVEQLIQSSKTQKSSKIQVVVGNIDGDVDVTFYKCTATYKMAAQNLKNCQITDSNKADFKQLEPIRHQNRGSDKKYWFNIQWEDYFKKADKDKPQVVLQMIVLVQNKQDKPSSYQIQYKNKDRIHLLREGQLVKERVFINEKRHYKLSIQDRDATEVRIHCTRISGQAFFIGSYVDPRVNKEHEKILPLYSILTFKINPDANVNQVFLQVQGVDNAYFSLTPQIIRKSQANPKKNGTIGYNELIVRQQIPYEFLIAPMDSIVLQVHSTSKQINLNLKSSSVVKVCMTQNIKSPPFAPNCQIQNDFFLEMNEPITFDKGQVGNIGIKNTNTNKNVTIKILISTKRNKTSQSCELAAMNQVMFKRLFQGGKDADGKTYHCLQYNLNKNQQVQLIVDLRGEHVFDQGEITASINDQQIIKILHPVHKFTKEQVEHACASIRKQGNPDSFCYLKVKIQGITNVRARILVQYISAAIRLMDGIAHPVHTTIKKSQAKHFYMGIHNMQDITIFLQNKVGEYKIYASLMSYSDFTQKGSDVAYPTKQTNDFVSNNPFYYLEQIVIITAANITQFCPSENAFSPFGRKWLNCILLISVYLDTQSDIQKNGKFVIEATQQNRELKEAVPLSGYLQKKSTAYYTFENTKNGTILIAISNQNKNCVDIYMKQGSERATEQYNDKHIKASNELIYDEAKIGSYSITLQAIDNCPYTISITSGRNNLNRIKRGSFADINLKMDEEQYFLYQNLMNETFKVLSLHKSGEVMISVNPVPKQKLSKILEADLSKTSNWKWSNKDSVRIDNFDPRKNKTNPDYCFECFYLIKIKAIRPTQASIVIPTSKTELPITTDSMIRDILREKETVTYRVFTQSKSQIQVYVQYGTIQVDIYEADKNKSSFSKSFEASKSPVLQNFTLSKTEDYEYLRYIRVNITASKDSYFAFSVVTDPDPERRSGSGIKFGLPEYIFLDQNKQKCVIGTMVMKDQFLISFPRVNRLTINMLETTLKINGKMVSHEREVGNTEMIIKSDENLADKTENKKFELCLKAKQGISITLIQSSSLAYWPQSQSIVIRKSANLTFGSEGKGIVEINQCQSRSSVMLFSEFTNIESTSSEISQRRKSGNIIEFYHYGPVYARITGKKSTARWFPVNDSSGAGTGYDIYKPGSLRILKNQDDQLQLTAEPLIIADPKLVKGKVISLLYEFYGAKQQMELYAAYNCKQGNFVKNYVEVKLNPDGKFEPVKAYFNIKQLKEAFGSYRYFLMGVKAVLLIKFEQNIEEYRFYYPYQQVVKQMLLSKAEGKDPLDQQKQQQIPLPQKQSHMLEYVGYAIFALVIIGVVLFIYKKIVKRCLNRRKRIEDGSSMGKQMKYFDLTQNN